jgi:hypothetical protein
MTDDLFDFLGLNESTTECLETTEEQKSSEPRGPYSVAVDKWDIARGQSLLKLNPYATCSPEEATDFFAAAFRYEPVLTGTCVDPSRDKYLAALVETPEYQTLRATTALDEYASEVAALEFARGFAKLAQDKRVEQVSRGSQKPNQARDDIRNNVSAQKAVEAAQAEVDAIGETVAAFTGGDGPGPNPGENSSKLDRESVKSILGRVSRSRRLKKIIEMAGRFRRVAQSKQRVRRQGAAAPSSHACPHTS